jgi:predicted amidophosphoribosyltransferase
MYCPNCGAQNNKKQNFCRYCGLHLQEIEKAFANQMVFGDETERLKRLRSVRRMVEAATFFAAVLLVIGVISRVFLDAHTGRYLITAGLLAFVIAQLVRGANSYLHRRTPRQNVGDRRAEAANDVLADVPDTSKLLEDKPFAPAASVTERTTRELQTIDRVKET